MPSEDVLASAGASARAGAVPPDEDAALPGADISSSGEDAFDLVVRRGRASDVSALRAIYNYEVTHGASTLDLTPRSLEERGVVRRAPNRSSPAVRG